MFIAIRKYTGCKNVQEVNRRVVGNVIPALQGYPGYQSYSFVVLGNDTVASISAFETREHAESVNQLVQEIVQRSLSDLLPNPPEVMIEGRASVVN